jgi:N-acyl-D-aspartate/D-glutamate deacylase
MEFTLKSAYVFESLGAWKPAMEAHGEALRGVYADEGFRRAVKADLVQYRGMRLFNSEWEKLHVVEAARPENREVEGRSLAELAHEQGKHPLDCLTAVLLNSDERAVGRLVADPATHVSLSDAGAHLTFFCDAGFGLHLLGRWSRERGVLPLEAAVAKLTGQPARLFGIKERGLLNPGYWADLLLFDPGTVDRGEKRRVFDLPAGAPRLTTSAIGVHGVWVNGERVADARGMIGSERRPGAVLRDFA